jgi:hypothetical protein
MPTKTQSSLLICRESFVGTFPDNSIFVAQKDKTIVDPDTAEGKRVLRDWSGYFVPIKASRMEPLVEQATAAPGERRGG